MMGAQFWTNVQVSMQSAIASAKTITAITKASPAVATCAGHGYSNGDVVYIETQGMVEANGIAVRVAGSTTDSFQLEGINSTDYSDFVSAKAKKVTLGTSILTMRTLSASGGDFSMTDDTTIHDDRKVDVPVMANAISYSSENRWDVSDAGLIAMKSASDVKGVRVFKFKWPSGMTMFFSGYVGCTLVPGGQAQNIVTTNTVFTIKGNPTYYAS